MKNMGFPYHRGEGELEMLHEIKAMMVAQYGERWLNSVENQNGMAEDLTILEHDKMRLSRKFGLESKEITLTRERDIVARYEVINQVQSLYEIDALFYTWWGHRASENICCVEREIADEEVHYHFLTGTPTHGHSGCVILCGREVRKVISKRRERRYKQLDDTPSYSLAELAPYDLSLKDDKS